MNGSSSLNERALTNDARRTDKASDILSPAGGQTATATTNDAFIQWETFEGQLKVSPVSPLELKISRTLASAEAINWRPFGSARRLPAAPGARKTTLVNPPSAPLDRRRQVTTRFQLASSGVGRRRVFTNRIAPSQNKVFLFFVFLLPSQSSLSFSTRRKVFQIVSRPLVFSFSFCFIFFPFQSYLSRALETLPPEFIFLFFFLFLKAALVAARMAHRARKQ